MTTTDPQQAASWTPLHAELTELRAAMLGAAQRATPLLAASHPEQRASALNLLHYTALRQHDRSELQRRLADRGLSSLGRSESHVLATVDALLALVGTIVDGSRALSTATTQALAPERGQARLREHAERLLGRSDADRRARIMVTLPSEAAKDAELVHALVSAGMDCARINAAHDDLPAWRAMARHVRQAARAQGRACLIAVDLPGPKCRTGPLAPGPEVIKLRPRRGPSGEVLEPARAWLTASEREASPQVAAAHLPVPLAFLRLLLPEQVLTLRDARGRLRRWSVASIREDAVEIVCDRTSYVRSGTVVRTHDKVPLAPGAAHFDQATVGPLPPLELPLVLRVGDTLALTRGAEPGGPARLSQDGTVIAPAHIPCEPPELIDMVRTGQRVWLDDGKIGGLVEAVTPDALHVRITDARPQGEKLRAGKGINLPDSQLALSAFTERDTEALAFAIEAADLVAMSFVRSPDDVRALHERVHAAGRDDLGIVLKIETREGFDRLPELLLAAMRSARIGVMIARGDLAVECGFERLAEVQEEILWLCEAAHVPVIWATQVLETVAKTGRPTRAEVTDAAMAERAECVMLNKGPYILQAVTLLDGILRRMASHQDKKSAMFRGLQVAERFTRRMEQLASNREMTAEPDASADDGGVE
jgi:pyruvate kinase